MKAYRPPFFASFFRVLGGLTIGAGALLLLFALGGGKGASAASGLGFFFAAVFSGVVQIGIGEVIDLVGRTAYYTQASHFLLQSSLVEITEATRNAAYQSERVAEVLAGAEVSREVE